MSELTTVSLVTIVAETALKSRLTKDLLRLEPGPQNAQRLLVVVEHQHAAAGLHLSGEQAGTRPAVEQHVTRGGRTQALDP